MNMADIVNLKLELRYKPARSTQYVVIPITITEDVAKCFSPLSPSHDFPFLPEEAARAIQQKQDRRELAKYIGDVLADVLLEQISGQDPVKGYSPEENRQFYAEEAGPKAGFMKKTMLGLIVVAALVQGCVNQPPIEHRLNDAYHRGFCDGRLQEIELARTNRLVVGGVMFPPGYSYIVVPDQGAK
jgi:hypothetical protein